MTLSSSVLTALVPNLDTDPFNTDCAKRHVGALPPFGVMTTHRSLTTGPSSDSATPTTATGSASERDAYDPSPEARTVTNRTPLACQWTGMPIRAIVPLPRRMLRYNGAAAQDVARSVGVVTLDSSHAPTTGNTEKVTPPCLTRSAHFWGDDADTDSSGAENGEERPGEDEDEESDEDRDGTTSRSRCCSYQSITAAEGLTAWSFEELRVECYAQSLVARGTNPPPVVQPSLAIPPAFVPRIIARS